MNVDEPVKIKKRKAPASGTQPEHDDPEAAAYNENTKDRFKTMQADAEMQFEDDFEDEFEEEEVDNTMEVGNQDDEDPQDEQLPPELESMTPDVRYAFRACTTSCLI